MKQFLLLGVIIALLVVSLPCNVLAEPPEEDHALPWGDNIQRNYNSPLLEKDIPGFGGRYLLIRSKLKIDYHEFTGSVTLRGRIFMTDTFTHTATFTSPNSHHTNNPLYEDVSSQDASYDFVFTSYTLQPSDFVTGWHEVYIIEDE